VTRTLLRGGRLLPATRSTALLVDGDTIAWIGGDDELPDRDRTVDLDGRVLTPAFVDAHVHLALTGFNAMGVDLTESRSATEALDLLAVHARSTGLGVVLGHSWDETRWAGGTTFTREALDRAVAGRPAYVSRVDLHSAFASTALLDAARTHHGHETETLDGWSGQGAVNRDAHHAVRDAMRTLLSADDRAAAIRHALQVAAARGIGVVHELGAPHISHPDDLALAERVRADAAREGGTLPAVVGYWGEVGALDTVARLGCAGAAGDICMDGALGSRTAALTAPYSDEPSTRGHLYLTADEVADHVVACTEAGVQAGFHVIGDRAVAEVVAGLEAAAARVGPERFRSACHRLEHLEMVSADQARRLGRLGLTASMQPLFEGWWGGPEGLYETRLGERARGMNPFASLAASGVALAFGSDSPVTPFDPWAAVRAAMGHRDPAQRLDPVTAFEAHTRGGWLAARREGGTLAPGAPAYLAVWDADGDPLTALDHPDHRDDPLPTCALTLVAGEVAYDGGGLLS
jgi:predicted amidohydrolase YtcJ